MAGPAPPSSGSATGWSPTCRWSWASPGPVRARDRPPGRRGRAGGWVLLHGGGGVPLHDGPARVARARDRRGARGAQEEPRGGDQRTARHVRETGHRPDRGSDMAQRGHGGSRSWRSRPTPERSWASTPSSWARRSRRRWLRSSPSPWAHSFHCCPGSSPVAPPPSSARSCWGPWRPLPWARCWRPIPNGPTCVRPPATRHHGGGCRRHLRGGPGYRDRDRHRLTGLIGLTGTDQLAVRRYDRSTWSTVKPSDR